MTSPDRSKTTVVLGLLDQGLLEYLNEHGAGKVVLFGSVSTKHAGCARMGSVERISAEEASLASAEQIVWNYSDPRVFNLALEVAPPFCSILLWNTEGLDGLDLDLYSTVHSKNLTILHPWRTSPRGGNARSDRSSD